MTQWHSRWQNACKDARHTARRSAPTPLVKSKLGVRLLLATRARRRRSNFCRSSDASQGFDGNLKLLHSCNVWLQAECLAHVTIKPVKVTREFLMFLKPTISQILPKVKHIVLVVIDFWSPKLLSSN